VLSRARELAQEVARDAGELERAGRLPAALLAALAEAGCLRMAVPERYGGHDLGLPETLAVVELLARANGSVGWLVGQAALSQVMVGYLPRESLDEVYADGPDLRVAGAAAPKGRAAPAPGGWRVTGRWPLVSGAPDAAWFFLHCLVTEGTAPRFDANGLPRLRLAVLPSSAVTVIETWDALGLRGTASHDVQVQSVVCPPRFTCELVSGTPDIGRIGRVPSQAQGGPFIAATALGIALGALDDLADLARGGKRPAFSSRRLADSGPFQDRFGDAQLTLAAARALLHAETARADALGRAGPLGPFDGARLRAAAVKAIALAVDVVEEAFSLAGSSAVYSSSPLQRRLRDVRTGAQHFAAGRDFYVPLGCLLAGETPPAALL